MMLNNHSRKTINFNKNWKFFREDILGAQRKQFSEEGWETVNLPHTPTIESVHVDLHFQGICWYRKHFTVSKEDAGKKLFIEFEAAMHEADVWIDGKYKLNRKGGYLIGVDHVIARSGI
jgi:beta-galactosidase